ncbi:rCG56055 [Rattus norvegicus]|uniref:RCG56055 n=1 Tax=Rattus norvegicus TaxID=10116 RepID=A6IBI1_RAT|nr:rCG56055 [Rattus norvegicus]
MPYTDTDIDRYTVKNTIKTNTKHLKLPFDICPLTSSPIKCSCLRRNTNSHLFAKEIPWAFFFFSFLFFFFFFGSFFFRSWGPNPGPCAS